MNKLPAMCDCPDPSQCWEPCGEMGQSEEHAAPVPSCFTPLDEGPDCTEEATE